MPQTITQLDLTRSILWEHADSRDKEVCDELTKLLIWSVDGRIYKASDTEIAAQIKHILSNLNKYRAVSRAIIRGQIVKKERTDDLIYE